ncbi:MAG: serine hydrolase domain-containing protein [Amaricoccus sp.]|uniref:serine hydrolase domain-containing protein n=1 Tax=Amaricoccus sp. TaxID=1872485 RepID=UPI0039E450E9
MRTFSFAVAAVLAFTTAAEAQQLPQDKQQQIAAIAQKVLKDTGVPSASVAVAVDGKLAYAEAFGQAKLQPATQATVAMAYPIGSISKQFTATAVLLLQQDGKLSIDDPVAKWFPQFTRAKDVKLRNLLTMTSGYEDFAPQDYIIPAWLKPVSAAAARDRVGNQAAGLRAWRGVAVFEHELRHPWADRGEGFWQAADAVSARVRLCTAAS